MATIKDVARRAGVAPASVTRVINGHPNVSDGLRQKVLEAVEECGYKPDLLAAGLRLGSSKTVGVIISDLVNPLLSEIVEGVEEHLRTSGYSVVLSHSHGDPARDVESIGLLEQRRVDGLLVSVVDETRPDLLEAARRLRMPVVLLDRQVEGWDSASAVVSDHRYVLRALTTHLLEAGHERIALIGGSPNAYPNRERVRGHTEALAARGLAVDPGLYHPGRSTIGLGESATLRVLDLASPPTAMIVSAHATLVGALQALKRRGVRVGREVALACGDDVPVAALHDPPITVGSRDTEELGRQAAVELLARIASPTRMPRTVVLPTRVRFRESTAPLAHELDPLPATRAVAPVKP